MDELFPLSNGYVLGTELGEKVITNKDFGGRMTSPLHSCGLIGQAISQCEPPYALVEFGTLFGGSAIVMARASKELHGVAPVFCVDVFDEYAISIKDEKHPDIPISPKTVIRNASLFGVADQLVLLPDYTYPLPTEMMNLNHVIGVVHVDANKDYDGVRSDLFSARRLKPRYIVVEDYRSGVPGVVQAVKEMSLFNDFLVVHVSGTAVIFEGVV